VLGANGQLGTAFMELVGRRAHPLSRSEADLTDPEGVLRTLNQLEPSVVVNCAAYTDVEGAEAEEELATLVNGTAVGVLADWCDERDVHFLTFSTDYVFDGHATGPYVESSVPTPINAYGRSKQVGEEAALAHGGLVVRTSWLLSPTHPNFVSKILELAAKGDVRVVDDQIGSPTVARDLAAACLDAVELGVTGLLHLTNQGTTTWYGLALFAVAAAGLNEDHVIPCASSEYATVARRPGYSALASERLEGLGLTRLPLWRVSVGRLVEGIVHP
jgi:dTDP-4-dehydrorhamnose reductase